MLGYPELFTIIYHKTQGSWLLKIASNLSTDFAFANIQTRGQQLKFESTKLFPKIYFVPSSLNNALTQQVRWVDFQTSDKFYQFIIYRYAHQECQLMKNKISPEPITYLAPVLLDLDLPETIAWNWSGFTSLYSLRVIFHFDSVCFELSTVAVGRSY